MQHIHKLILKFPPTEESATPPRAESPDEIKTRSEETSLVGRRVLIVDDDERNVFALQEALESKRLEVFTAESGMSALRVLEAQPDVELVLMDIMMPGIDGYETMRRIRAQEQFRSLPIIALTARAMQTDRERCLMNGASDYVAKPVGLDHLLTVMKLWLLNRKMSAAAQ